MKHTYMMNVKGIESRLNTLWKKYQAILKKPTWPKLNEARAILFLTGRIYCEQIAPKAIERRLKNMKLITFLTLIDTNSPKLKQLRKDKNFQTLEQFYKIVKNYKNKFVGGKHYKDEERFIKLYNQYAPTKPQQTSYKGIIKLKE